MFQKICRTILFDWMGWKADVDQPIPDKCIICIAPHTSNWDFFIGKTYYTALGRTSNFLMKKEWFFWPLGPLFRRLGGIPVFRDRHTSMTDNLANTAKQSGSFRLCVTPEGTRSLNPDWKKGFYYIALKAQIPVLLYGVDFEKKLIECTRSFVPTGNFEEEMREIKLYFKPFKGKHPELFTVGDID